MSTNTEKCANWREHVILSCPAVEEMQTIVRTLKTADADWPALRTETVLWMDQLIGSLGEFMDDAELDAFIVRLNQFFYREAMIAGQAYHQSTNALFNRPPGSQEKWNSVCTAMVAGTLRTTFEGICAVGMSWLSTRTKDQKNPAGTAKPKTLPDGEDAPAPVAIRSEDISQ